MVRPLPEEVRNQVREHASRARAALGSGDSATAECEYLAVWNCIPEPRSQYAQAQSVAITLVQFYRDTGRPAQAREWFGTVRKLYATATSDPSNDFLGATVEYEAGNLDAAFEVFETLYKRYKT